MTGKRTSPNSVRGGYPTEGKTEKKMNDEMTNQPGAEHTERFDQLLADGMLETAQCVGLDHGMTTAGL
jgi:hypothetical protein